MFGNLFSSNKTTDTIEKAILTAPICITTEREIDDWTTKVLSAYENLSRKAKGKKRKQLLEYRHKFHTDVSRNVIVLKRALNIGEEVSMEGFKFPFEI